MPYILPEVVAQSLIYNRLGSNKILRERDGSCNN